MPGETQTKYPENFHHESNVKVYFTRDYTRFKSIIGNRLLSEPKIKRIIKDIQNGLDLLKYCPIVVDKDMNVIDGQHRLYVARQLKSNVWYVITSDGLTLEEIAKINSNQERWKTKDFLHCYVAQNNPHYNKLQEFMNKYDFPLNVSIQLLSSGTMNETGGGGGSSKSDFEHGKFEVKFEDEAEIIAQKVLLFSDFDQCRKRNFVGAITRIYQAGKCDFDKLHQKYIKNKEELKKCDTVKEYLKNLEDIYNIYSHTRTILF